RESAEPGAAERTIVGQSCQDVFAALVLMVALAVDPNAMTPPEPTIPEPEADGGDAGTPRETAEIAAPDASKAPIEAGVPPTSTHSGPPMPEGTGERDFPESPIWVGLEGVGIGGLAPRVSLGGDAFAEWRPRFWSRFPLLFQVSIGFVSAGTSTNLVPDSP